MLQPHWPVPRIPSPTTSTHHGTPAKPPSTWERDIGHTRTHPLYNGSSIPALGEHNAAYHGPQRYATPPAAASDDVSRCTRPHCPPRRQDIGWQALGPALACTLLAMTVVGLRWYARARIARCVGVDDWVILVSMTFSALMTALTALQVHQRLPSPSSPSTTTTDIAHLPATTIAKLITVNNALWILTVTTTKLSLLLQYLRIFSSRPTRTICYILLALLLPTLCWGVLAGTFMCHPIAALWDPSIPGKCLDVRTYFLSVSGLDITLDFCILALPLPSILALQLPRKQRTALILVFSLGFFVCVISVVRLAAVLVAAEEGKHVVAGVWAIVWSAVEANVGIICASLLALKPVVVVWWPGVFEGDVASKGSGRLNLVEDDGEKGMGDLEKGALESSGHSRGSSSGSEVVLTESGNLGAVSVSTMPSGDGIVGVPPRSHQTRTRLLDQGWRLEGHEGWLTPIPHPAIS